MSSTPAEPKPRRKRKPYETWRKVMLTGALILLGHALLAVFISDPIPRFVTIGVYFVGYALLVVGFGMRMRGPRSEPDATARKTEEGPLL